MKMVVMRIDGCQGIYEESLKGQGSGGVGAGQRTAHGFFGALRELCKDNVGP